jgi:exosortase
LLFQVQIMSIDRIKTTGAAEVIQRKPSSLALPSFSDFSRLTQLKLHALSRWWPAWWQAGILIVLIAWLYSSIIFHLILQWNNDPNFSHGFLVPGFSLFVLWRNRARLLRLPRTPSPWGFPLIAMSLAVLVVGVLGAELFLSRISLLFLVTGLVLLFMGDNYLRATLFPLSFLFLMIPIPAIIFNQITLPLQILASKLAATALPWVGVPVFREGNIINLPAMSLEIAEACSGIRSLFSLITVAIIYSYAIRSDKWARIALALAATPIAIAANSFRIIVTGVLGQYWSPNKAEGFFHTFSGWLVFLASLGMLFLLHRILAGAARERRSPSAFQP